MILTNLAYALLILAGITSASFTITYFLSAAIEQAYDLHLSKKKK